ncbi:hypothetical protein, partial [Klebsiella pneumoniae]|uniref:hypothetical protein n=1 Tax=Klebsiella pneumoniae TaxID=573 RepID=UPI0025A2F72B
SWLPARTHSAVDVRPVLGILGGGLEGSQHRPALAGSPVWLPTWRRQDVTRSDEAVTCTYRADGLLLTSQFRLDQHGVLVAAHEILNT